MQFFLSFSFQKHLNMGQCVKSSRYLSIIPAVTIECAEVDGDSSSTPIFFEDCYVNKKGKQRVLYMRKACPGDPCHKKISDCSEKSQ